MAIVQVFDRTGRGLDIQSGGGALGSSVEETLVSEQFLGAGYYRVEVRLEGSPIADTAFYLYRYDSFIDQAIFERIEGYLGGQLTLEISQASFTALDLAQRGIEGVLLGNDNIIGNSFHDLIRGFSGNDRLEGLAGNDTLFGGIGNDTLFGNDGNDTLIGQENNDVLYGGAGNDSIDGNSENDLLIGGDGNDTLNGQEGFDELQGGFGNDILNGGSEDDLLFGEAGDDTLNGQQGNDELQGGLGNDSLLGGVGADLLFGEDGNDIFNGAEGNDTLIGGGGQDSAVFFGFQDEYILQLYDGFAQITDRFLGGDDRDDLVSIEQLSFLDANFDLSQFDGTTGLSEREFESFIELYIAYFNRAPDALGLNFWGTVFSNGVTLEEIATYFIDQDETRATYPDGTSNTEFVTAVYNNVLGRIPDQGGFDFWVGVLNSGGVSRDQFILEVLRGVQDGSSDRAYLNAKVDVGAYFAVHRGMSDVENASAAMALFDGSQGSINQAVTAIDGYYQDALDPNDGEFLMQVVGVLDNPFSV